MSFTLLPSRFRRSLALFLPVLLGLAVPTARAVTTDDVLPANLIGKTVSCSVLVNAGSPNTIEPSITSFQVQFTSATNYVRSGAGIVTEGGTYTVVSTTLLAGTRTTALTMNNNWLSAGSTTPVLFTLSIVEAFGVTASAFTTIQVNTTNLKNGGEFTFGTSGGTTGGGGTGTGGTTTPTTTVASYAGSYTGSIFVASNGAAERVFTTFTGTISSTGVLNAQGGEVTGTVNTSGIVTFDKNALGMTTGSIVNQQLNATGTGITLGATTSLYRIFATGGTAGATVTTAPANLVGYRNKVGQSFQFAVTGSTAGAVWGTDIYTDDSTIAAAAVHAGVLLAGETKTVTITVLPGQSSYAASNRNSVRSSSWGAWTGSYSFAGTGTVTGTSTATAKPALVSGYTATTTSFAVGGRLVFPISVIGGGTYTYQWYLNNILISGATANPYVVASLTTANAGTYTVDVTNSLGTTRLTAGTVTVGASGSPVFALQPFSKSVAPGGTFTLATSATGSGLTYQWFRNNVALSGETGPIILRQTVTASDAGSYTVRVSNSSGSITSSAALITLSTDASRPANISVRTNVATGAVVVPGFVIQGTGSKRVLIRAVGPGLGAFGLTGLMADPKFSVYQGSTKIAESDDWAATNIGSAFTATGAFALTTGSKDAALVTDLPAGKDYTVQVTNATGNGGIVLIEVYDADILKGSSTSKLVNVSVLGQTSPGADILTLGLVIQGSGPRTLLVRGIGPKLAAFGVGGTIADPRLQIYDSQQRAVLANDDWNSADFVNELVQATTYVGAFALDAGSKDAATLTLLDPGAYTVTVGGAGTTSGQALVEIYEVP